MLELTAKEWALLSECRLFSGIDGNALKSFFKCISPHVKDYARGEYVLNAGSDVHDFGIILSGTLLLEQDDFWGNRHILLELSPPQLFAESYACLPSCVFPMNVFAQTDARVLWIASQKMLLPCDGLCHFHSQIILSFVHILATKNTCLNAKLTCMAQRTTREKLLFYFSSEAERVQSTIFELSFTRQELADFLAVERSAMSAELSKMQKEGILKYAKNRFEIIKA